MSGEGANMDEYLFRLILINKYRQAIGQPTRELKLKKNRRSHVFSTSRNEKEKGVER